MKFSNQEKVKIARKLLNNGLSFDKINKQLRTQFDYGISRKILVELRKEMIKNQILDNSILRKLLVPLANLNAEIDLEKDEKIRMKELFDEVISND